MGDARPGPLLLKVYTRPGCLFCGRVCELLRDGGFAFTTEEVSDPAFQDELVRRYRAVSFPIVMAGSIYVGGYAHVSNLASQGRLAELVSSDTPPSLRATRPQPPSWTGQMDALKSALKKI